MIEAWVAALGRDYEMTVYYTDEGDQGRGWSVRPLRGTREVRLTTLVAVPKYGRLNAGLLQIARTHDLLLIGGFEQVSYLAAAVFMRVLKKKVVLLFDGFSPHRFNSERPAVRWIKRITANLCDAYFANGTVGARYLRQLNVAPKPIFNQYLSAPTPESGCGLGMARDRAETRRHFNLPDGGKLVAFCGYLIERKRLDLLLVAVSRIPATNRPVVVVIGSGPLLMLTTALAKELGVDARFMGFQEGANLRRLYRAVDLLVLPSSDDPWGLVVNEAMFESLPVIVSDACGCAEDLVVPHVNGLIFRSGSPEHLTECLQQMLAADLESMGRASRSIIEQWTPENSGRSLSACVTEVMKPGKARREFDRS